MRYSAVTVPSTSAFPIDDVEHDDFVVLRDVAWEDYLRISRLRGEKSVPRLTYLEGVLELMSPSHPHESITSTIGRLVEAWCMETGVEISPVGRWTLRSKASKRGLEPDECYVIGDEPGTPQRPHLAIEVTWTSGGIDKLEVYRKLGVPEVWYWEKGKIRLFGLRGERYVKLAKSAVLPGIDVTLICAFVATFPMTRAVREYRAALRLARE